MTFAGYLSSIFRERWNKRHGLLRISRAQKVVIASVKYEFNLVQNRPYIYYLRALIFSQRQTSLVVNEDNLKTESLCFSGLKTRRSDRFRNNLCHIFIHPVQMCFMRCTLKDLFTNRNQQILLSGPLTVEPPPLPEH